MQFLSIGVNEMSDDILKQLTDELQQFNRNKVKYSINEVNSGESTSIICSIDDDKAEDKKASLEYSELRAHISNVLADYIIKKYEEKLVFRIINSNYCYFNAIEKREIYSIAVKMILSDEKNIVNSLFQMQRRNVIIKRLMDYFDSSSSIILDGFVNFRLKDYTKELEEVVDKAVDDFLMEREYKEFIRLLKYFVEIQEPKFEVIHVVVGFDNKYVLLDESKREITNDCIQDFVNEISEGEINYDDLLVSSLITLAPKKVILHGNGQFKNKELLETIKNVFSGRVTFCSHCEICSVNAVKH